MKRLNPLSYGAINIQKSQSMQEAMDVEAAQSLIQPSNKPQHAKQFLGDYESKTKVRILMCCLVVAIPPLIVFFSIKYFQAGGFESSDSFSSSEFTRVNQTADVFKSIIMNTTGQITEAIQNKSLE